MLVKMHFNNKFTWKYQKEMSKEDNQHVSIMSVIAYHESVEVTDQERVSVLARVEVISHLAPRKSIWYQLPVSCRGLWCPLVNLHWPHLHLTWPGVPGGLLADNENHVKSLQDLFTLFDKNKTWVSPVILFEDQKREKCNTKELVKYCRDIHCQ